MNGNTSKAMEFMNAVSALKDMVQDIKNGYIDPVRLTADVERYGLEAFTSDLYDRSFELAINLVD